MKHPLKCPTQQNYWVDSRSFKRRMRVLDEKHWVLWLGHIQWLHIAISENTSFLKMSWNFVVVVVFGFNSFVMIWCCWNYLLMIGLSFLLVFIGGWSDWRYKYYASNYGLIVKEKVKSNFINFVCVIC